jgi:Uma2 family endonuclease
VVKAPDWVYITDVKPLSEGVIRRSYTPRLEGDIPLIVLEFISETEGTEYSMNPHYPYGKWYFYERIIQVPLYGIFQPETKTLDLFRLVEGRYENPRCRMKIPVLDSGNESLSGPLGWPTV